MRKDFAAELDALVRFLCRRNVALAKARRPDGRTGCPGCCGPPDTIPSLLPGCRIDAIRCKWSGQYGPYTRSREIARWRRRVEERMERLGCAEPSDWTRRCRSARAAPCPWTCTPCRCAARRGGRSASAARQRHVTAAGGNQRLQVHVTPVGGGHSR
jgi:hypothetical protein